MDDWDPESSTYSGVIEREVFCGSCITFMVRKGLRSYRCPNCGQQYVDGSS